MSHIIISAAKFESDPLINALQQMGSHPECKVTGVGAINAAKGSRALADSCRGKDAIFVGTCGTFGSFKEVSLVRARTIHWNPTAVRTNMAYTIGNSAPPISLPDPAGWALTVPPKTVLCSPAVSLIKTLPDEFKPDDCVENLELYSCISEVVGVANSLTVLLAITNELGPDAHTEWKQNYPLAAGKTAEFVIKHLRS